MVQYGERPRVGQRLQIQSRHVSVFPDVYPFSDSVHCHCPLSRTATSLGDYHYCLVRFFRVLLELDGTKYLRRGAIMIAMGFVKSWSVLAGLRVVLGVLEVSSPASSATSVH